MIEQSLQNSLFNQTQEKTFIDKILSRQDVEKINSLIKKDFLNRSELVELQYLIGGVEAKLVNYSTWDRYVMLKFYVWIREFVKICELLYDYEDYLDRRNIELSPRAKKLFSNNQRLIQHNAKFLIDLYLNMARTTLSLGGTGFMEILKNKYEVSYNQLNPINTPLQQKDKRGLLSMVRGKDKND